MIDSPNVRSQVPQEFKSSFPRFILFMEKYYEWLYRGSGLSDKEIEILKSDTSWLKADIDRFIESGDIKYIDSQRVDILDRVISQLDKIKNPGYQAKHLQDNFMLESEEVDDQSLDKWFAAFGIPEFNSKSTFIAGVDKVLLVSLMKHIFAIKGTETAMKLFFNICFNEDVTIYQPKKNIAVIDDNWILDDIFVIRNDDLYQEFSYVIVVNGDVSKYTEAFDNIYRLLVHPAGFRVAMVKASDFAPGKLF